MPLAITALILALRTPARIALPLILGIVLFQRTLEDGRIYPALPQRMFYPPTPILAQIQADKGEPFRMGAMHFMFLPDAAALYGLEDVRGYEAMTFLRLAQTYALWCRPHHRLVQQAAGQEPAHAVVAQPEVHDRAARRTT